MLEKYLKDIQIEMEIDTPFPSKVAGEWEIPIDEDLKVTVSQLQPTGFSLRCDLGPYPTENEEDVLNQLMTSNLFGQGTLGAVLGIDEDAKQVVLALHVERDVDYQEFKQYLEDFLEASDSWHEEIIGVRD